MKHFSLHRLSLLLLISLGLSADAASPVLNRVLPRGGQRGTELTLTVIGQRIEDAQELLFYSPGITVTRIEQPTGEKEKALVGKQFKAHIKIAPDARVGEYCLRLRTATGISEMRSFWVGSLPVVAAAKPDPKLPKKPQEIPLNVTVEGAVENESQDLYAIQAKKGQRISVEVEGMRLGETAFDPFVAILDDQAKELARNDDNAFHKQDPILQIIAPADGKYIIQIRESAFGGGPTSFYRMHVGTFPRPRAVFPLGGKAGDTVNVTFLGDISGPIKQTIKLPDKPVDRFELFCTQDGLTAPSGNPFRVSEFGGVNETEPNDAIKTATTYTGSLPAAFNGVISGSGDSIGKADPNYQDHDFFKFAAKKGQVLEVRAHARSLRSPLDPLVSLHNATGGQLAANDDSGGPDSYFRYSVPADGDYFLRVRDHLRGSSPQHAYRVEITSVHPSIAMNIPLFTVNYSQERNAVIVPRGGRYATLLRVTRADVPSSPFTITSPNLPPGLKMIVQNCEPGVDAVPVVFEAAADSKNSGTLLELHANPDKPVEGLHSSFRQPVELVTNGNQAPYYVSTVDRMAVAVGDPAPFDLNIIAPKVPLVQGGEMKLKVQATRKNDFKGAINVRMVFRPPGVEAAPNIEIPADKTEIEYPINASDAARVGKWHLCVLGSAEINGTFWQASPFIPFDVAAPFVTAKIANANVEQGQETTVSAALEIKNKWPGKAKVELIGLPGNSTSVEKELTADDAKVEFPVTTAKTTPAAMHKTLFLRVTVMQDGEPIVHNIARGGTLRVDSPLVAKSKKK